MTSCCCRRHQRPALIASAVLATLALIAVERVSPESGKLHSGLIAFADAPGTEPGPGAVARAHIFTVDAEGNNRKQLTQGPGGYLLPAWSPTGEWLAFVSVRGGFPDIGIMKADGSGARSITRGLLPAWSPDGQWLAFFREQGSQRQVWLIGVDGKNEKQLTTTGSNAVPSWAPDGEWIAYWSGDERGYGQIWVMRRDGSAKRQLTFPVKDAYTPAGSSANAPGWLFSQHIAYWAGTEHAYGQIWTMDAQGGHRRQLTTAGVPASSDNPTWSPDGTKILFDTQRRGLPEIWVMNADGSDQHVVITDLKVVPARASWQPVWGSR